MNYHLMIIGNTSQKKNRLYNFFGRQKRHLTRITEPSNNDFDNDVSDNCDHNFGTFDDFGVKNDQTVYT